MPYRIFTLRDAKAAGCNDPDLEARFEYMEEYDYTSGVFLCDAQGNPKKLIGTDGGEPEDQTLGRDWNWVMDALNEAYRLGQREEN